MGSASRQIRFIVASAWAALLCAATPARVHAGEPSVLDVDAALRATSSASPEDRLKGIRALGSEYASAGRSVLVLVDLATLDSAEKVRAAAREELARLGATGTKALIARLHAIPDEALVRTHSLFTDYLDSMSAADLTVESRFDVSGVARLIWMALGAEPELAQQMAPALAYVALHDSAEAIRALARDALAHWGLTAISELAGRGSQPPGFLVLLHSDYAAVRWMAARLLCRVPRGMDDSLCLQLARMTTAEGPAAAAAAAMALAEVGRNVSPVVISELAGAVARESEQFHAGYASLKAAIALGRLGATEPLRQFLGIPTRPKEIRFLSAVGLSFAVEPSKNDLVPLMDALAPTERGTTVSVACEALRRLGTTAAAAAARLRALAERSEVWMQVRAARALIAVEPVDPLARRILLDNLRTPWGGLAAEALGEGDLAASALPALIAALEGEAMPWKVPVVRAISVLGPRGAAAVPALVTSLEMELASVGKVPAKPATPLEDIPFACTDEALLCLVRMGKASRASSGVVTKLLESKSDRTRWRARLALAAMAP